jgi:hypothetical protein
VRKFAALVGLVVLVLGYTSLAGRIDRLKSEFEELRRIAQRRAQSTSGEPKERLIRSPSANDLITVIANGRNTWSTDEWPICGGSTSICVDRVFAPCDQVELAYSYGHMSSHKRYPVFTVRRGAMADHTGKALSPQDIFDLADREQAVIEDGASALADAERGDRTKLIGDYAERGEIDIFRPAGIALDVARCSGRESRFQIVERTRS